MSSTNEHALSLLSKSKPPEGTVISTPNQWAGRGQIGSNWESEPDKNISLSVILYPNFLKVSDQFLLNQTISLAVHTFIKNYFPNNCTIKWPNDILIQEKKVAGILIQNSISGNTLKSSVVGIGININQQQFSKNAPNATSFFLQKGELYEIPKLTAQLCHHLEKWYLKLKSGNAVPILQPYLDTLYRFQLISNFKRPDGQEFTGKIIGISPEGRLKITSSVGIETFGLKEIQFILQP